MSSAAVARLSTGAALLVLWETVVRAGAPSYVAKPSSVALAIPRVVVDRRFLEASGITLSAVAEGLAIALVIGTLLGLLMGRSMFAERVLRHYVNGFYAVPMIVVLPLVSLWFGYTCAARLATIVFAAVFSIIINVADGARSVPREYLEVARVPVPPRAHDDRRRPALGCALLLRGSQAGRRARAGGRHRRGILHGDRRPRLLHPL